MSGTEASAALARLRMTGLDQAAGRHVQPEELIRLAVDALLAGVDTPSLRMLAGLGRNEELEARGLFRAVLDELDLSAEVPERELDALRSLAREVAAAIVNKDIEPVEAAHRIWQDFAAPLDYPPELMPFVRAVSQAHALDLAARTSAQIAADIRQAARDLLASPE